MDQDIEKINFDCPTELKRQAQQRAKEQDLNLAQHMRRLIKKDLESADTAETN